MSASTCTRFEPYDHLGFRLSVDMHRCSTRSHSLGTDGEPRVSSVVDGESKLILAKHVQVRALESFETE